MSPPDLSPGLYERLLDEELSELLARHPELIPLWEKLDDECEAHAYSQFVAQMLRQALPSINQELRIGLINRMVELLGAQADMSTPSESACSADQRLYSDNYDCPVMPFLFRVQKRRLT